MKDIEIITINNKDYGIMKEIPYKECIYLYLSCIANPKDTMIRKVLKSNEDDIIVLQDNDEFELACTLLLKEDKNSD